MPRPKSGTWGGEYGEMNFKVVNPNFTKTSTNKYKCL